MLADPANPEGRLATGIPGRGEAWPDQRLADRLGVKIGDRLSVGESTLTVTAVVQQEPEVAGIVFALGPKLLLNIDDVPATNLLQPGNRATWRLLVADRAAAGTLESYRTWLGTELKAGQRLETVRDLRPEVRQTLERAEKFLGLAALVAVLLAAVAVALAASRYLRRHLDAAAMFRCFGARVGQTLALFFVQFLVLGVAACAAGLVVAWAGQQLLVSLLASVVATDLPSPSVDSRRDVVRDRHAAALRLRAAAARGARERAAAARAAARPAAPARGRRARVRPRRRDDRAPDRLPGARSAGGPHHGRRRGRTAARVGARRVAAARAAEEAAAARRHVALRPREPAPPRVRVEPADRRARARPDGAAAAHRRPRRPDAQLAREPAAGRAQPVPDQRAARAGRRRARATAGRRRQRRAVPADGARAARRAERRRGRHEEVLRRARAPPGGARVQPVVGGRAAQGQHRSRAARSGRRPRRPRTPACRSRTASPRRSA